MRCRPRSPLRPAPRPSWPETASCPLVYKKNTDFAAFIGAQSLHKPANTTTPTRPPTPRWPRGCPICSPPAVFAHYLKCIVRDKIGSFKEADDMQRCCKTGSSNMWTATRRIPQRPPRRASPGGCGGGRRTGPKGNPGYYSSKFFLRPHYQLEGLNGFVTTRIKAPLRKAG